MFTTIKSAFSIQGLGVYSGINTKVDFFPNYSGRIYLEQNKIKIPASLKYLGNGFHNTTLQNKNSKFVEVEHILSALYGMGINSCRVVFNSFDAPMLDGSSYEFAKNIFSSGRKNFNLKNKKPKVIVIKKPIIIFQNNTFLIALPHKNFKITYVLHHQHKLTGIQSYGMELNTKNYLQEVASARTFAFKEDIEKMQAAKIINAGDTSNAIIIDGNKLSAKLRFKNEFTRHKILDIIGDLALSEAKIQGHIIGYKSGHSLNYLLAKQLLKQSLEN